MDPTLHSLTEAVKTGDAIAVLALADELESREDPRTDRVRSAGEKMLLSPSFFVVLMCRALVLETMRSAK